MIAAYLASGNINPGIAKQSPIIFAVNRAEENNSIVGKYLQAFNKAGVITVSTHHQKWPISLGFSIGANDQFGIVFRLQSAHIKQVFLLGKIETLQCLSVLRNFGPRS